MEWYLGVEKEHIRTADWLEGLKGERDYDQQEALEISEVMVKKQCKKIPIWKAPGWDGVQGSWIKRLDTMHGRIASQLNEILNGTARLPKRVTYGGTVLCQKDPANSIAVDTLRPISCLPLTWKLTTGILADNMYDYLERERILPEEQKGCRKGRRGTKDQLLIDKAILKDCRKRHTNLAMAWIDYQEAYDMVLHSWIVECLEMFGIAENVKKFLIDSMKTWKTELTSSGERLGVIHIRRGIFQGDSLSPLLFVLSMIPLTLILRKSTAGYDLAKEFKVNHLLFMDDLKLFGKSEDQIDSLVQSETVQLFSEDIGMEFGLKKCGVLLMKRGKKVRFDGITLFHGQIMREIEEGGYKYLGILEVDMMREKEMKKRFGREYKRRLKLVLKSKLNGKNKINAINTWAVSVLRYGAGIIRWTKEELKTLDRKTRIVLTMNGSFHPKSDVDRLYVSRLNGGRGLISFEGCVRSEENSLGWYVKNSLEVLLQGVRATSVIRSEVTVSKGELKTSWNNKKLNSWKEKRLHGQFVREYLKRRM